MPDDAPQGATPGKGKIPMWVYLAGGGVVVLLLVMRQGGGGAAPSGGGEGLLSSEVAQRLSEQQTAVAQQLAESKAALGEALAQSKTESAANFQEFAATQAQLAAESESKSAGLWAALQKQLADMQAALTKATTGGGTTPASGERPTGEEVARWAAGIGLPLEFGFAFVNAFGRLPSSIPELEAWRPKALIQNDKGQWCAPPGGWPCL